MSLEAHKSDMRLGSLPGNRARAIGRIDGSASRLARFGISFVNKWQRSSREAGLTCGRMPFRRPQDLHSVDWERVVRSERIFSVLAYMYPVQHIACSYHSTGLTPSRAIAIRHCAILMHRRYAERDDGMRSRQPRTTCMSSVCCPQPQPLCVAFRCFEIR